MASYCLLPRVVGEFRREAYRSSVALEFHKCNFRVAGNSGAIEDFSLVRRLSLLTSCPRRGIIARSPKGTNHSYIRSSQSMTTIPDTDRDMIFNTINQCSSPFTENELNQIHEIALKLHEIYKSILARIDNSQFQ